MARKEVTWKSAPRPVVLAEYAPLMCGLTMIAPNGVLPPKLTTLAMLAIHRSGRANFSGKIDEVWAEDMSGLFRCLLSKYRELHNNNESRRICFSRCSMDEMQSVNTVLANFRSVAGARAENNDEELAAPLQDLQDQEAPAPVMTLEMLGSFFASVMGDDAPDLPGGATPQRSAPGSPMVTPRSSHSIASTIMYAADEDCIFERYVLLILRCRCS